MRVLVWQWGRRGAGPRFATVLAESLGRVPGVSAFLSLSTRAEILNGANPPCCDLPVPTYAGFAGFLARLARAPLMLTPLRQGIAALRPDVAICAMPGPLDLLAAAALARLRIPFVVVVHDADPHPGDGLPLQMTLQRRLLARCSGVVALSDYVAARLKEQGVVAYEGEAGLDHRPLFRATLPPFVFAPRPPPPRAHGGKLRLLSFGRLLPYKGLDLLADALDLLGPRADMELRVVGSGPESATLDRLRAWPNATVENRWAPEDEVGALLAWADAIVLSHREASQSGVAAAAIAARRFVIATRVGGLAEQLRDERLAILCQPEPASLAQAIASLRDASWPSPNAHAGTDLNANANDPWQPVAAGLIAQLRQSFPSA